jgi:general secretion pathway protein F
MRFAVRALDAAGAVTSVEVEAVDDREADRRARERGLLPLTVRRAGAGGLGGWLPQRRSRFPLVQFSQELLALLDSGISLVEAIETLAEKESRSDARSVLLDVRRLLGEGRALSAALDAHPLSFPPLYVAAVRAAERSGALSEALTRYVAYQNQIDLVRKKVVSALIYPVLLMVIGTLVTLFLLGYVVPRFSFIYDEMGTDLPWLSRALLAVGRVIASYGGWIALGVLVVVAGGVWAFTRPASRRALERLLWRTPGLGERLRIYQLARFYRTVSMLLRGGTPVVRALDMVGGLLQPALRASLVAAAARISEGQPMSVAFTEHGLTTPVALRMLRVGERSGRMGDMMERIAVFYDDEMARFVEWFTRLFEPLLMTAVGLIIGLIVVLMYLPIFELAGSVQ